MPDQHVRYPDDMSPPDDPKTNNLHIVRDDQGDFYITINPGPRVQWAPTVRLCMSGGAGEICWGLCVGMSIAHRSLLGEHARARRTARQFGGSE